VRPVGILFALLPVLAGCESSLTAPASPDIAGHWGWEGNGNPGGSYMTLTLATAGDQVTGAGGICGIGPNCNPGSVKVIGTGRVPLGSFALRIGGAGSYLATYSGHLVGVDELQGTWTVGSQSWQVILDRCTTGSFC